MDPAEKLRRYEHRRARLAELLKALEPAPRAWFATAIRRSESYVARLLHPEGHPHGKNIGDAIMNAATSVLQLDPGWFDLPLGSAIPQGLTLDEKGRVSRLEASHVATASPSSANNPKNSIQLTASEHRLLKAFHLLPDDEQDELLRDLSRRAERYRVFAERLMRERETGKHEEDAMPIPDNVRAPHFPSTRARHLEPPEKRAPAADTPGPSGRPGGKTGKRK